MSNLGGYQDIVVAASKAGGVQDYLDSVKAAAVAAAAAPLLLKGALIGGASVLAVGGIAVVAVRQVRVHKKVVAGGREAELKLREALESEGLEG